LWIVPSPKTDTQEDCKDTLVRGALVEQLEPVIDLGPDCGQFLQTEVGCVLISSSRGVWMQEVDFGKKKTDKHSIWYIKQREEILYHPSGNPTYGSIQAGIGIAGIIDVETGKYVVFSDLDHMIPIRSLDCYNIWDCYFPNSDTHIYGLFPGVVPKEQDPPGSKKKKKKDSKLIYQTADLTEESEGSDSSNATEEQKKDKQRNQKCTIS
jgi:hypothetical protein